MTNCKYISVVQIDEAFSDGSWVVTSPDLPGLFLAGYEIKQIRNDIPAAIKQLYRLNYEMDVEVCPTSSIPEIDDGKTRVKHDTALWAAFAA